jgi:hypothetical protein
MGAGEYKLAIRVSKRLDKLAKPSKALGERLGLGRCEDDDS